MIIASIGLLVDKKYSARLIIVIICKAVLFGACNNYCSML